jgi:hypothetical protein
MLSYVCNQRRDIDCTGGVNGSVSLCLRALANQSIVALVTEGQTARKATNCNLPPFTLRVAIRRPSGKQAAKSGWAERFSSEV